jgi:hypothetical protein
MVKMRGVVYIGNGVKESCVEGVKNPPFHLGFLDNFEKIIVEEVPKMSKELYRKTICIRCLVTLHLMDGILEFILSDGGHERFICILFHPSWESHCHKKDASKSLMCWLCV